MAKRNVSIFINGREVANQMKSIAAEKRKVTRELNLMTRGTEEYKKKATELKRLNGIISEHKKEIRGTASTWGKITTAAKGFLVAQLAAFTAEALVDYGKELFTLGGQMELLGKKAATVFGEALPLVTKMAEENANAMGLTVGQYTDAAAAIGDLLIPMGFQREEAANISTNLVNLSGALSEWTGGQVSATEVTDILGKAMLGEREQLKGLGIAISEADVKNRLAEKGLSNLTGEMLQQAKAAATLELITEKSGDAQAAFAANSDTLVRKQAELSARFETIKEQMASALIPVFHRLFEAVAPVVEGAADLATALLGSEEAGAKVSPTMRVVATIIRNVGNAIGFLFGGLQSLAKFMLNNFGGAVEYIGVKLVQAQNLVFGFLNSIGEATGIDTKFELINVEDFKAGLADAKKALNESGIKEDIEIKAKVTTTGAGDKDAELKAVAAANKLEKEREKAAEKEEKALEKRLDKLKEIRDKFNEEAIVSELSAEDKKIAQLAAKFDAQIKEALALEAKGFEQAKEQRIELERLKEEALDALREEHEVERSIKKAEANAKELEDIATQEQAKADALKEIQGVLKEEILAEEELERLAIDEQYAELIALAEQHGIDTLDLELTRNQKIKALNDKHRAAELKSENEKFQAEKDVQLAKIGFLRGVSSQIGAIAGENAALADALFVFEKGLAVAEVIISLQKQLAAIRLKYSLIPGGIALAAAEGTKAKIDAGLGIATIAGSAIAKFTQKKHGGWHNVTGPDDGISYTAKYIGAPSTGLLPNHPVVLASEVGSEYFVSHRDLQNPYVLDHVRAIENVRGQYRDGGGTIPSTGASAAPAQEQENTRSMEVQEMTLVVLLELRDSLQNLHAKVDDETALAISDRLKDLSNASGGTLG